MTQPRLRRTVQDARLSRARALAILSSAAAAPTMARAASGSASVRVGSQPAEFTADLVYGMNLGFFAPRGVKIDLQMMSNSSATAEAILGGALDIGITDPLSVAEAHVAGIDLVFIAPGAGFAPPWPMAFCTHPDLKVKRAKDLDGLTVGVNGLRAAPGVMSYYWIDHNGGDSKSIKWVEMRFPLGVAAILDKRIDGMLFGEPFVSQARDAGLTITLLEHNTSAVNWMVDGWVARRSWINANLDAVRGFATGIEAANRWANTHVAETIPMVAQTTKMSADTIKRMMPHPWVETLDPHLVQPVLDTCATYGVLKRTFPAKDIFYVVR